METKILSANTHKIEDEIIRESRYFEKFQPFVNEFLKNEYDLKGLSMIEVIRDITYNGTLHSFIKEQALMRTSEVNNLPIIKEAKMAMIDASLVFENYPTIESLYNSIRSITPQIKEKIFLYDLDNKNKLILSEVTKQKIIDSNTIYANEHEYKAFEKGSEVLNALIDLKENFGIDFFTQNIIQRNAIGTLKGATLRAEGVKMIVSQFMRSHNMAK